MIVSFINKYPQLHNIDEIKEIKNRIDNHEDEIKLVKDFTTGGRYLKLRDYLWKCY